MLHGVAEGVPASIDLGFEIAGPRRKPCRELRHDAPGEVLELTGSRVPGRQDGRTEALDMSLAVERQRSNVMCGHDLPDLVEDDHDPEIGQLILTGARDHGEPIADLLE